MHKYKYWAYGLKISSQVEFPELFRSEFTEHDVTIELADKLKEIEGRRNTFGNYSYILNQTELLFEQKEIGRYLSSNGNQILMQPDIETKEAAMVRLIVLNAALPAILLQRKQIALHASGVLYNNKLILIAGESGAGKSTTLAGLIKSGHRIFSDDVVAIDQNFRAFASYPMMKIWEDTQLRMATEAFNDKSYLLKSNLKKYGIFFHDTFITDSYEIDNIIILKKGETNKIATRKLNGIEKFKAIQAQIFKKMFIMELDLRTISFEFISHFSQRCSVYEITRPEICDHTDLITTVESLLSTEVSLLC